MERYLFVMIQLKKKKSFIDFILFDNYRKLYRKKKTENLFYNVRMI
jgi:hypothetical protein